ncbi:MAG TPA: hypothetical protein VEV85_20105, partial [Bryobacteraceae bacterium]|nr:hypothetical protein [Bryobacteraceae bacterium]
VSTRQARVPAPRNRFAVREDFPGLFKERIGIADSLGVWASSSPSGIFRRSLSLEIKWQFVNGLGEV